MQPLQISFGRYLRKVVGRWYSWASAGGLVIAVAQLLVPSVAELMGEFPNSVWWAVAAFGLFASQHKIWRTDTENLSSEIAGLSVRLEDRDDHRTPWSEDTLERVSDAGADLGSARASQGYTHGRKLFFRSLARLGEVSVSRELSTLARQDVTVAEEEHKDFWREARREWGEDGDVRCIFAPPVPPGRTVRVVVYARGEAVTRLRIKGIQSE